MYEQHFGLTGLPFCLNPAEWQFFESASSAEVIPQIQHALSTASGIAIVTGPEGVGKTVLLHQLQTLLSRQGQAIVIPGTSLGSVDDLYVGIRRSLRTLDGSLVPGGCNRWEIVEHLKNSSEFWGPAAFLIDDAHLLTSGVYTELQFLLEQRSGPQALCRLLLAGSLSLEETLAAPAMHGFAQRIRTFSFLTPLRLAESIEYLRSRLKHAGGELAKCFASDAVELIVEAADGSPRCLNLLADESMMLACQQEETQVTRQSVVAALDHLKHLPHAWNVSVTPEEDTSLNDSVETSSTWESSSDGVIEIGAPSSAAEADIPAEPEPAANAVEFAVSDASLPLDDDDEFPTLDELQQASSETDDVAEIVADEFIDEDESELTEMSFEDGYRLAEMESVGTPSVEIDDDLDRRLLEAAENAPAADEDQGVHDTVAAVDADYDELLPEYHRWIPAGSWVSQASLQDELIRNWIPVERSGRPTELEVAEEKESDNGIGVYEVRIPAAEEPAPEWPPVTGDLGPARSIPVSELDANMAPQKLVSSEAAETEAIVVHVSATEQQPEPSRAGFDNDTHDWSDGQLLTAAEQQDAAHEAAPLEDDIDASADAVRLKIAELEDQSDDVDVADDATPKSDSKQLFTLPIALDEVSGECGPLAESVRDIQRDLDEFQATDHGTSLHTPIPGPLPKSPQSDANRSPITEMSIESVSTAASDSETLLRPPQWISRAHQVASVATPAAQLRPAAGAESYNLSDEAVNLPPALSVPDWSAPTQDDSPADEDPQESPVAAEPIGFRNLFTRIRRTRA